VTGVVAALVASVGDLLLLATANTGRPGWEWLPGRSETLLLIGTYLGIVAIPCYGLGYRAVARRFEPRLGRALVVFGAAGGILGGTTHGLTGLTIHVTAPGDDPFTVVARYGAYLVPLWALIVVAMVVGSGIYTAGVLRGHATLPPWMALASPITLLLGVAALSAPFEVGEAFLVPASPNLAHVLFFGLVARCRPFDSAR